jgi:hypothetical protein
MENNMDQDKLLKQLYQLIPSGAGIYDVTGNSINMVYLNDGYYQMIGVAVSRGAGLKEKTRQMCFTRMTVRAFWLRPRHLSVRNVHLNISTERSLRRANTAGSLFGPTMCG